ncbi:MAG: methylenetetrahydrofolate reductase [NAD(P)H] [Acidimicrobiia bacterium]|nr:methylenetetrahydrofolate reductase [NAD(P)H] [Acidimicrobiia bacterium]
MRVTEHLERSTDPFITFEIIPPTRGGDLQSLLGLIEDLMAHRPPFIDITSHAAEVVYEEVPTGYEKRIKRKRPGTLGVCALIQNKFNIDAVPHILCEGFTREETEDFLIELRYLDIDNVFAIRGDSSGYEKRLEHGRSRNLYASDLIAQVADMNKGVYLEELLDASPTDFCVGAAGYPEKHFEAPNLTADVARVKQKVDAGAEYVVTQMFFENQHYFDFVGECRSQGITVPIIPGIKVLATQRQVVSIPRTFHCEIPAALAEEVMNTDEQYSADIGVAWAAEQTRTLLERGVPSIHFYVMQSARLVNGVLAKLDV